MSELPDRFATVFAENLALKLIGLLATVAVIAAVGIFIVKPILDTVNNGIDSFQGVNDSIENAFDDFGVEGLSADEIKNGDFGDIQRQIRSSGLGKADQRRAEKLLACVQRVAPNTKKMQACAERFG